MAAQPTYSLQSCFDNDKVRVYTVSKDVEGLTRSMKQLAQEYVYNEIGKNNYVDTLNSEYKDKRIKDCPEGFVLRMIKPEYENYARKLNVYFHTKTGGWTYGYTHDVILRGYFAIIEIDELDQAVVVPNTISVGVRTTPSTHGQSVDPGVRNAWASILPKFMDELGERQKRMEAAKLAEDAAEKSVVDDNDADAVDADESVDDDDDAAEKSVADDDNAVDTDEKSVADDDADDNAADESNDQFKRELTQRASEINRRVKKKLEKN